MNHKPTVYQLRGSQENHTEQFMNANYIQLGNLSIRCWNVKDATE